MDECKPLGGGGGGYKSPGKVKEGSAYQTETRKVILSLRKVRKVERCRLTPSRPRVGPGSPRLTPV